MLSGNDPGPGSFCWVTLSTRNPTGAREFYGELFDWRAIQQGPFGLFLQDGQAIGSFVDQRAEPRAKDNPPAWLPFVRVRALDEILPRVKSLGGAVLFDLLEVPQARVALIRGVTGEQVGLWEPREGEAGPLTSMKPGAVAWFELATPSPEPAREFYSALLGWRFTQEGSYIVITQSGSKVGGVVRLEGDWEDHAFLAAIGQAPEEKWEVPPHWMVYFPVRDIEGIVRKAEYLGARVTSRPAMLHTFGHFAVLRDPQAAYFCVLARA
jgi:uncharacterized protein